MLAEPGGNDVPTELQTTGDRTLGTVGGPKSSLFLDVKDSERVAAVLRDYGYESMAVVLDSIERAEDPLSRADVVAAFLATSDRQGETGTYTIGPDGAAAYAVAPLSAPG
jgi:hypothetical protein